MGGAEYEEGESVKCRLELHYWFTVVMRGECQAAARIFDEGKYVGNVEYAC